MSNSSSVKKPKNTAYYIKAIIGLAIMIGFGYIPAPAPITQTGMAVLGQFIGLVFLWTTVDMVWPTFAAIVLFGFVAFDVYPQSFALAGVYEAGMQSIGNWCSVIMLALLIFCEVLNDTGIIRRIALWFLGRKTARKSPWGFTFMFLLSALVVGLFLDVGAAQVLLYALATEIFVILGVGKEDKWAKVISIGILISVVITFAATPICHTMPLLFMGIYSSIAGVSVNWLSYMGIAVPCALIIWVLMLLFMRFIVKPDMTKVQNIDYQKIDALHPGPMSKKEKFVIVIAILLIISWILPGFLSVLAPNSPITAWLDSITMLTPLLVVLVIFAIVRIDGSPVLDIIKSMKNINWMVYILLAGIMMIASAMGESTTGISDWVMQVVSPLVQGMPPFVMVALMCVISVVLTNIANNIPVGIVLITIGVPLSLQMGINPFITAVAVSFSANLAFTIPPAFVPVGTCYAYPYGGGKYTLRWGIVAAIVSLIITGLLIYPLGSVLT